MNLVCKIIIYLLKYRGDIMNEIIWEMYRELLQGHASVPYINYTVENLNYVKEYLPVEKYNKILEKKS
jgi:hypothetical protein